MPKVPLLRAIPFFASGLEACRVLSNLLRPGTVLAASVLRVGLSDVPEEVATRGEGEAVVLLRVVLLPILALPRNDEGAAFFDLSEVVLPVRPGVGRVACLGGLVFKEEGAFIIVGVVAGLAGVIVTFRERLEGWILAGEEGLIRGVGAAIFGLARSGTTIEDLDAEAVADVLRLPGAAGFGDAVRPGVITVARRELLPAGRLVDVLLIGVMTVLRRVAPTAGRVADLPMFDEPADDFPVKVLTLEVLLLMGVTIVVRLEVDEGADERVLPVLATCTERFTGLVVLAIAVGRRAETLGADLGARADLVVLGVAVGRDDETLGAGLGAGLRAGLLAVLVVALRAGRETRARADLAAGADRLFGADLEAEARADDRAGADLAERADEDGLPLGGLGLPNAGPQVMIAVRNSANSVFSACLTNIFLSPFPGRSFGFWKKTKRNPAHQTKLSYSVLHELAASWLFFAF